MYLINIVDAGIGNFQSVANMCDFLDLDFKIVKVPGDISSLTHIILPGVGSFDYGMRMLNERGWTDFFQGINLETKVLGICLGMQLIGNNSEESPGVVGLGLIEGSSKKLVRQDKERIPNIGWAATNPSVKNSFSSLSGDRDFYFVHSYTFEPIDPENILCTTRYGETQFVSGVISEEVIGFQFHPEKSARAGAELISDVISWGKYEI